MSLTLNSSVHIYGAHGTFLELIVSYDLYPYLKTFFCILALIFSLPAICFNIINVVIFCKIGVTDSITLCFLYLALSDFGTMITLSIMTFFTLLVALEAPGTTDLPIHTFTVSVAHSMCLDIAAATTTYIALQRGLCVAWPFLTRHTFTRNRSLAVLLTITVLLLACELPRAVTFRYSQAADPASNSSQMLVIEYLDIYDEFNTLYLLFIRIILSFAQYIIMSVCAVAIAIGMRSSIKLKSSSSTSGSQSHSNRSKNNLEIAKNTKGIPTPAKQKQLQQKEKTSTHVKREAKEDNSKKNQQKGTKELLVIKQALTVVLLQVLCTTPGILVSVYSMVEPRFQLGAQYNNLFFLLYGVVDMSFAINAFSNFFIYLNFNSKFKDCFKSTVHCGKISLQTKNNRD
ncbi:chemosensory receptor c [Plakobranchus ocellatus]|uniref:Chemosensory receptor c n=1 Tax=Plakobranchus ocellatus TaxID=259542 RepID=A0AAV4AQD2_9GAST|nr:chemosensory receptor c [Plakobranchus ocellatus]